MSSARPWEGREEPDARPYLRAPQFGPDGEQFAFVSGGEIWLCGRGGGTARLLVAHAGYNDRPRFSPDGRRLAFTSRRTGQGDLYCLDLIDGSLRQLTFHDGFDVMECWTPDGEHLWFGSGRNGRGGGLHEVPAAGGTPILVWEEPYESFYNVAFSPDGTTVALNNNGDPWWRRGPNRHGASQIWLARRDGPGGPLVAWLKLVDAPCRNAWPMWRPDGAGVYFISDRDGAENLWYQPLSGGEPTRITECRDGRMLRPTLSPDGRVVLFERDFGICSADTGSGRIEPLPITVHATASRNPLTYYRQSERLSDFTLSPDGRKVLFVAHGKLFADFADKTERPKNDSFPVSDTMARESQPGWHPDGGVAVYLSDRNGRNDVYCYDFVAREERRLTREDGPHYAPRVSPDGRWIAYCRRPDEIRLIERETGEDRPFMRAAIPFVEPTHPSFAWSPDSRWIAFVGRDERFFSNVYVQNLEGTQTRQVTFLSNIEMGDLLWSPDGRFLIVSTGHHRVESQVARVDLRPRAPRFREEEFAGLFEAPKDRSAAPPSPPPEETGENGNGGGENGAARETKNGEAKAPSQPEPVEIVFEGIRDRLRFLTPVSLHCSARRISPDAKYLVYVAQMNGQPNFWYRALEEERRDEPAVQLTASSGGKGEVWFTPDAKRIYWVDDGRVQWRAFPKGDTKGLDLTASYSVNFHREKRQVFREAWSLMQDHFYDLHYHGADWPALFLKFWPAVLGATRTEDLHELLNLMVGELRASHLGAGGPENGAYDGYLGILFDPREQASTGALRVTEVLADGPAAVIPQPVRVGEYLVALDGTPVARGEAVSQRLRHRVGKRVLLSLNDSPSVERARQVGVRPISAGEHDRLRYREWVRGNAAYVERVSGGRLGYAHVRAMNFECYTQLVLDLDTQTHGRDGVVVDVRFNPGGYVAPFILDLLQRRAYDRSVFRGGVATSSVNLAGARILDRPTVVLTNEHSGSNTEMFSEGYRYLGLGKVVGRPTAGAVIWTWGWQLLDGSSFRLPRIAVQTLTGENLEGTARPVDVDVEQPPGEWHPDPARRRDRQLDAAVSVLLSQIDGTDR